MNTEKDSGKGFAETTRTNRYGVDAAIGEVAVYFTR